MEKSNIFVLKKFKVFLRRKKKERKNNRKKWAEEMNLCLLFPVLFVRMNVLLRRMRPFYF